MSKPSAKTKTTNRVKEAENVGGLDEQIYQFSKKAARGVRRFRVAIGILFGMVVAVAVVIWAVGEFQHRSELELAAQFHALVKADANGKPLDAEAVLPELESLVQSARGRASEAWILKQSVTFLLDSARARIYPRPEGANDPFAIDIQDVDRALSEPTVPPSRPADALLDKAAAIVREAQSRLPSDADLEYWAASSLETIESLRHPQKPAEKRPQKPILPPKSSDTSATPAAPPAMGPEPEKK